MIVQRVQLIASLVSIIALNGFAVAQTIRDTVDQANIDRAETHVLDLLATFDALPDRWAARQQREIVNTYQLANGRYSIERIEEVWAFDRKSNVTYTRFSSGDRVGSEKGLDDQPSPFDNSVLTRQAPGQILRKIGGEGWTMVPALPNIGSTCSHPLNWALGGINEARLGRMYDTKYIHQLLLGIKLGRKFECIRAFPQKDKSLVSYWGFGDDTPLPWATRVIFSKEGLPLVYDILGLKHQRKADIETNNSSLLSQSKIEWRSFGEVQHNGKPISLPVRVVIQSTLNRDEELECINQIVWKFGERQVPDSTFIDPTSGSMIEEPEFEEAVVRAR